MSVQQILTEHQELFSTFSNAVLSGVRFLGWWAIRGLAWVVDQLEGGLFIIFQNLDFFSYRDVGLAQGTRRGMYQTLLPVFWALLTIGIVIVGFMLITNRLKSKANIPVNLMLIIVLVLGMPTVLNVLNNITSAAVSSFRTNISIMDDMIRENVYDLAYLDTSNFSAASVSQKNRFSNNSLSVRTMIDPMETMDYNRCDNTALFKSQLNIDSNGEVTVVETANKNMLGIEMLDKLYYRYKVNWFVLFVSPLSVLIALTVICVKTAKNIFEITYSAYLMLFIAPLDITTGQRTKKIIEEIINLFGIIILTLVSLQLYVMAMTWAGSIQGFAFLLMQVGLSFGMIGGPRIVQKILGIGAGVGEELQSAAGAMYMASGIGRAAKGAAGMAGKLVTGAGKAAAGAGVAGAVGAGGLKATIDNMRGNRGGPNAATDAEYTVLGNEQSGTSSSGSPRLESANTPGIEDGGQSGGEPSAGGAPPEPGPADGPDVPGGEIPLSEVPGNQEPASDVGGDAATQPPSAGFTGYGTGADAASAQSAEDGANAAANAGQPGGSRQAPGAAAAEPSGGATPEGGRDEQPDARVDGPAARRVTREDTLGSALGKLTGSTRPAQGIKGYAQNLATAFHVGENSVNEAWHNYRNQEKPVPHVYAEPLEDNPVASYGPPPDEIIIEPEETGTGMAPADSARTEREEIILEPEAAPMGRSEGSSRLPQGKPQRKITGKEDDSR